MERRPKTCVEAGEFADVSPTIENITSVATYDLASIRPDAVIVNQGDNLMATTASGDQVPIK